MVFFYFSYSIAARWRDDFSFILICANLHAIGCASGEAGGPARSCLARPPSATPQANAGRTMAGGPADDTSVSVPIIF